MLLRKAQTKKKSSTGISTGSLLDSSLTSIEWLPNMQIGENSSSSSAAAATTAATTISPPIKQSVPTTTFVQHKIEATEIETPTSTFHENIHVKPPYSYVTLIRQAILSTRTRRMTLNEIYQWITDSYPYFRNAPPKWKNSIRHNLSLNKCFKRLQRSTNDPGKGSYWAVEEACESNNQMHHRKRKSEDTQPSPQIYPSSPVTLIQQPPGIYTHNNPMICGDISSVEGQSSSTDESDSRMSITAHSALMQLDDLNAELTASFRLFQQQILESSTSAFGQNLDGSLINSNNRNDWTSDLFPNGESNSFFQSIKIASSGEINWNDIDVKPYCEFLDDFLTNSTLHEQDRDKLIDLASSLSSFFDYTGITSLARSKKPNESFAQIRPSVISNRATLESNNTLPVVMEEEPAFDWDSIA
ncbi:unnamed protein product [Rotaria socialis]|uniref:Fork-head domain-containing protein n=1 Tax=Rotaria socialis TaxID=392032 RepID=A0A818QAG3_9BILA|nr:unnamed protein product [Rotaria socialis]CAF3485988.1 unnamed protein product [Rotaria socialis]CAF3636358.1 unnamed protein product [Rotaria socialis]CAF4327718.1 unnamed protein product [Rotaria socialis]CAF4485444.1 unnamed protein product [Rotaria socialis]